MDVINDRVPPQNLDIERAVLGELLNDPETLEQIRELLTPEVFYQTGHRKIYRAICGLWDAREAVDILTVQEALDGQGDLEAVGGAAYLAGLSGDVATSANIEYHTRLIYAAYIRRRLIDRAMQLMSRAYQPEEEVEGLLATAGRIDEGLSGGKKAEIQSIGDILPPVVEKIKRGVAGEVEPPGLKVGIPDLDDYTNGLQPADFIVLAARPSMGKTSLGLFIARKVAETTPVLFVSREMQLEPLALRLLSLESRLNSHLIRRYSLNEQELGKLVEKARDLAPYPILLTDKVWDMSQFVSEVKRAVREHGIGLIVSDYLQLFDPSRDVRVDNEEQRVSSISRMMNRVAKETGLPHLALAQLSRAVEVREDKRPRLSDLRGSGSIEQDADVVLFLYRPKAYGQDGREGDDGVYEDIRRMCEIIVGKQRNGPTGMTEAFFDDETGFWAGWRSEEVGAF